MYKIIHFNNTSSIQKPNVFKQIDHSRFRYSFPPFHPRKHASTRRQTHRVRQNIWKAGHRRISSGPRRRNRQIPAPQYHRRFSSGHIRINGGRENQSSREYHQAIRTSFPSRAERQNTRAPTHPRMDVCDFIRQQCQSCRSFPRNHRRNTPQHLFTTR